MLSKAPDDVDTAKSIVVIDDIPDALIVAHRGGPLKDPDASLESFHAAADADFPLAMDTRALQDGTLVPSHDRTVDRTVIGALGKLARLTKHDWDQLQIRAVGDGEIGAPTTWKELIDTFGGNILMIPQIDESGDLLDRFIASITDQDAVDSVIVQSWSLETSKTVADCGLHALQLVSEEKKIAPETIAAAEVGYVDAPMTVDEAYVEALKAQGLDVWVYTVNTVEEAKNQYTKGAVGVFTDDPWLLAGSDYK